jgi:ferredoxin
VSALVADCASDPPLGATGALLAETRAEALLLGLGVAAARTGKQARAVRVRSALAAHAVRSAAERLGVTVTVEQVTEAWPSALGPDEERWPAALLVALGEELRGAPARGYVTVAGAVVAPAVLAAPLERTVRELVQDAGGATVPDWVAVAGGLPAGALVERGATLGDCLGAGGALILVLPQRHAWVRRLRTPVDEWLQRALSACEGCSACTELCPVGRSGAPLAPDRLVRGLAASDRPERDGLDRCLGCGLCDVACPSSLSPRAVLAAIAQEVRPPEAPTPASLVRPTDPGRAARTGASTAHAAGLDRSLLTLRLGLGDYAPAAPSGEPLEVSSARSR